jgi:hypothetical protein
MKPQEIEKLLEELGFSLNKEKYLNVIELSNHGEISFGIEPSNKSYEIYKIERGKRSSLSRLTSEESTFKEFYLRMFNIVSFKKTNKLLQSKYFNKYYFEFNSLFELDSFLKETAIPDYYYNFQIPLKKDCFNIFKENDIYKNIYIDKNGESYLQKYGTRKLEWENTSPASGIYRIFDLYYFRTEERRLMEMGILTEPFSEELLYAFLNNFNK